MSPMKVLISGAGIAGNALAFWLSKLGHDVTVVEWYPTLRATGLQLDLRGHGIQVMKRMGLEQAFRANAAPEQGLQIVDGSGRQRALFPANRSGKGLQSFTTDYEVMRGDLCRLMYDAAKDRARYVFGTSVEAFEQSESAVNVVFKNGQKGSYDLLVGADGQNSRTRGMMRGSAGALTHLGGSYAAYFTTRRPMRDGEGYMATAYFGTDKRIIMTRRHSPDEIQVYLTCNADSEEFRRARKAGGREEKEAMASIFRGVGWKGDEYLDAMMESDDFYCEHIGLVKMGSWTDGRVTFVGDAGYCPSSTTGMGTTSAMVGAYVLAGEIGIHCGDGNVQDGLRKALAGYEERFRPFMDQVQRGVAEDGLFMRLWPTQPFGIAILNAVMGVASFLRLNLLGEWILKEDVKGWDLPDYQEMRR